MMNITAQTAILCFGMAVFSCCEKENIIKTIEVKDTNGVIVKKKYLWKIPTSNSRDVAVGGFVAPIAFDNKIIVDYFYDADPIVPKSEIQLLDLENQKALWQWKDYISPQTYAEPSGYLGVGRYKYNDTYIFHAGPRTYCIDLNTGQTKWKNKNNFSSFPHLYENDNEFYVFGNALERQNQNIYTPSVYKGDANTGEMIEVVIPNYSGTFIRDIGEGLMAKGLGMELMPVEENGEKFIFVGYNEYRNINQLDGYIGLYNITQKKWVYEQRRLFSDKETIMGIDSGHIIRRGNKIYLVCGNIVEVRDWRTGERIWVKNDMPSFANILGLFDDKYLMLYDSIGTVYCVDADTGQEYWKQTGEVLSYTAFYYDQGIYYYLADGKLKARDFKTRKLLWEITADTDGKTSGHFWVFVIGVPGKNGEKGKIYTRTGFDMYCYEAIK